MKPPNSEKLQIIPIEFGEACEFVRLHHRHHLPPVGHKFSVAVSDGKGDVRGVAIVGRPVARRCDDGWTMEVYRVATDGCPNACSALYGACRRAVFALGYRRLITFTLGTEPGTSLAAAGWKVVGETPGRSWSVPSRPRVDKHPIQRKIRWEAVP